MKNPRLHFKLSWLAWAALLVCGGAVLAQPSDPGANKKPVARTKPQVIYHLPPSSNYAATLHSQAKGQNNDLPVDASMPISLQMSRANANAAAAQARQEAVAPPPQEHQIRRTRVPSNRSARPQSVKPKGPVQSRPKSHKE